MQHADEEREVEWSLGIKLGGVALHKPLLVVAVVAGSAGSNEVGRRVDPEVRAWRKRRPIACPAADIDDRLIRHVSKEPPDLPGLAAVSHCLVKVEH